MSEVKIASLTNFDIEYIHAVILGGNVGVSH